MTEVASSICSNQQFSKLAGVDRISANAAHTSLHKTAYFLHLDQLKRRHTEQNQQPRYSVYQRSVKPTRTWVYLNYNLKLN